MKTWIKRSYRTFPQTAVGYTVINIATLDFIEGGTVIHYNYVSE